ncbi:MAG: histidinol dehydrogenase [Planctomycetes bacterium RBG_13_44_8b]|nr:MAG: histidinol dehydrogenase [Planctomycetes bacterium RBG_13_44_8b]
MKELKNILISYTDPNFGTRLQQIRELLSEAAHFKPGDGNLEALQKIIYDVFQNKDAAVVKYTDKFDRVKLFPEQFRVSIEDFKKAHSEIDKTLLASIRKSISNVRKYQEEIFTGKNKTCSNGTGIKYTPIERIGICVPGASAPLPSTVIMTAVPAQVAGVEEIAVVSPPRYKGSIHPVTLAVCYELGINEVYRIGGVQAVAALAYGTNTIKSVDMIVGPGNQWVQTAKRFVFGQVKIDSLAGPSEVLLIADDNANPAWVAADMLSQAEHAPGSAILFTVSETLAKNVLAELKKQTEKLNRSREAIECLNNYGGIFVFNDISECIGCANDFASEHLQIQCGDKSREIANKIENAGAIFIGEYSPVATGDYWAGPSHTLPTGRGACMFSALSCNDFIKATSIIEYSKTMLKKGADDIIRLAEAEGLDAHANSVKIRFK